MADRRQGDRRQRIQAVTADQERRTVPRRREDAKRAHIDIRVSETFFRILQIAAERNLQTPTDFARANLWDGIRDCMSDEEIAALGGWVDQAAMDPAND